MTTYVFLGPSLPLDRARAILEATYLPPIQQGDLLRLLELNPRYVGIVDGYFETVPAVWHKEILLAMSKGVHVFGAASMGALRAAELQPFGMIGVGQIFQWFRDETIVADDEVAVRHGPAEMGYLPLNQSLVDIRDGCAVALEDRIISLPLAEKIVSVARALPFWDRDCESIAEKLRGFEAPELREIDAWIEFMENRYVSLKGRDAAALLERMKAYTNEPWQPKRIDFVFEQTIFIDRLINEVALDRVRSSLQLPLEANRDTQMMEQLRRAALLRVVARDQAKRRGWEPGPDEIAEKANAIWSALELDSTQARARWMTQNSVSEQTLLSYISDELCVARLNSAHRVEVERELALQMLMTRAGQLDGGSTPVSIPSRDAAST
jgi:hypothetical protein